MGSRSLNPQDRHELPKRLLHWGCCRVPLDRLAPNSLLIGTPGSGKTLLQKLFMLSLLPDPEYGLTFRAAIFDPKRELYPFFMRIGIPPRQIVVTHPYDTRSSAWHFPSDFTDPSHAQTLADAFIPRRYDTRDKNSADFWVNAANQTLLDIILALMAKKPDGWDLRDITEGCADPKTISQVLQLTPSGRDTHRFYFEGRPQLAADILATLRSYMREFEPLAALWHHAQTTFSIRAWRAGSGLLLLGADPERPHLVRTVNTLLIRRMSQVLLAHLDEQPSDLTWLLFDELREAGRFEGFQSLLTNGRSKGVRIMLGFQDTFGLNAAFGTEEAKEILGICDNKALLHLGSPEAAQWASDLFHERESAVSSWSVTDDMRTSRSTKIERVRKVLPIQFHELPLAQTNGGRISAYFHHAGLTYKATTPGKDVAAILPRISAEELADLPPTFQQRPAHQHKRVEWTRADYEQIGITPPPRVKAPVDGPRLIKKMPWHK